MSGLEETARNHYQNGEYAQALSAWLELSQNFPGRDDYLVSSGNCFDALGDKKAAAGYYLKAHKVNKKSLPALTNLAIAAIAGIALNAILPGKDYEFGSDVTEGRSGDFGRY